MAKFPAGTKLINGRFVDHIVHLGDGKVRIVLKDGESVVGFLRKAPRRVPSARPEEATSAVG